VYPLFVTFGSSEVVLRSVTIKSYRQLLTFSMMCEQFHGNGRDIFAPSEKL